MPWAHHAKIAFIGSHGIRKTTAALSFASVMQRAGRSVEFAREVVRDNPLGMNDPLRFPDYGWPQLTARRTAQQPPRRNDR